MTFFFLQIVTLFSYANMLFKSGRQKGLSWPLNGEEKESSGSGHPYAYMIYDYNFRSFRTKEVQKWGLAEKDKF